MHAFVTSKNVKWCHLIWPTLYIDFIVYLIVNLMRFVIILIKLLMYVCMRVEPCCYFGQPPII